jgi:hypothetical protein
MSNAVLRVILGDMGEWVGGMDEDMTCAHCQGLYEELGLATQQSGHSLSSL